MQKKPVCKSERLKKEEHKGDISRSAEDNSYPGRK